MNVLRKRSPKDAIIVMNEADSKSSQQKTFIQAPENIWIFHG